MALLTPKQELFVAEYLKDLNATQAAIRAGYSKKTAYQTGYENLNKPDVAAAIAAAQAERLEKAKVDAAWVLERAVELYETCMAEPVVDRLGLPVLDPVIGEPVTRINIAGALKALELVGKHVGVQAWQTKAMVDVNHDYANLSEDEINAKIAEKLAKAAVRVGTKH